MLRQLLSMSAAALLLLMLLQVSSASASQCKGKSPITKANLKKADSKKINISLEQTDGKIEKNANTPQCFNLTGLQVKVEDEKFNNTILCITADAANDKNAFGHLIIPEKEMLLAWNYSVTSQDNEAIAKALDAKNAFSLNELAVFKLLPKFATNSSTEVKTFKGEDPAICQKSEVIFVEKLTETLSISKKQLDSLKPKSSSSSSSDTSTEAEGNSTKPQTEQQIADERGSAVIGSSASDAGLLFTVAAAVLTVALVN